MFGFKKDKVATDNVLNARREIYLEEKVELLEKRLLEATKSADNLQDRLNQCKKSNKKLYANAEKLKKMVREQIDADLLSNALQAMGIYKPNDKDQKSFDPFTRQDALMARKNQLEGLRNAAYNDPGGFVGGLGGMFGGSI